MWQRISRFYPPWLDLLCFICLGAIWSYTAQHYGAMPQQIPTHFGFNGMPDAWSAKSFVSVYMLLIIGTVLWLAIFLTNYFLIMESDDPRKYINIPGSKKDAISQEQIEAIRQVTAIAMALINLTMVLMFLVIQYGVVNTARGLQHGLGWEINALLGILLLETAWLVGKTYSISAIGKKQA